MNPIRIALHNAARTYAKSAHAAWLKLQAHHERAFEHALRGNPIDRRLCHAQYVQLLKLAHRARGLMK